MDIMNRLPDKKFEEADDLLAFISIYDDKKREKAYKKLLTDHASLIRGKVCLEAGCGLGIMAEHCAKLGARTVYAVEVNPHLFALAKDRLKAYDNVTVIKANMLDFIPPEPVDLLVHDFFGQLLYDEELYVLERLKFAPAHILPDTGILKCGVTSSQRFRDPYVDSKVVERLDTVLVSGLFDERGCILTKDVCRFSTGKKFARKSVTNVEGMKGDLLFFGIEISHNGKVICRSGDCENWSYVWTHKSGEKFSLSFEMEERAPIPVFRWMKASS